MIMRWGNLKAQKVSVVFGIYLDESYCVVRFKEAGGRGEARFEIGFGVKILSLEEFLSTIDIELLRYVPGL